MNRIQLKMLNKGKILKGLSKGLLLYPGTFEEGHPWFCSFYTLIAIFGMSLTLANVIFMSLKCPPEMKKPPSFHRPGEEEGGHGCLPPALLPPPPPHFNETFPGSPSVVVDIVISATQIEGFVVNLIVRLMGVVGCWRMRSIFHCLSNHMKHGTAKWRTSFQRWTNYEQLYLCLMAISLVSRELSISGTRLLSLVASSCPLKWEEELVALLQEQSMIFFSLESGLEVASFLLLAFMGTFTHFLQVECEQGKQLKKEEAVQLVDDGADKVPRLNFNIEQLLMSNLKYTDKISTNKPTHHQQSDEMEIINEKEMENLIESYFEMSAVWKHAEGLTGAVTLIIFLDHTLTFCLNVFLALAALTRFGLDNRFLGAVVTASIIISKMICVGYMAQSLPDACKLLADRLLHLRWKLLDGSRRRNKSVFCPDYSLGQIISYVRDNPLTLSALGYFTVSKPSLTAISGVIVTYLVVLVQFHVQMIQLETASKNGSSSVLL